MYSHPVYFAEAFIDPGRFRGTCYRAANWQLLGLTTGRGKNDHTNKPNRPMTIAAASAARCAAAMRSWGESGRPRGGKLMDGSLVSCGCWRANATMPAWGSVAIRYPATPGRQAEPVVPPSLDFRPLRCRQAHQVASHNSGVLAHGT